MQLAEAVYLLWFVKEREQGFQVHRNEVAQTGWEDDYTET
jgi:hypothetical protein